MTSSDRNADLVRRAVHGLLRREASAEEVASWSARLESGDLDPADLIGELVESAEYRRLPFVPAYAWRDDLMRYSWPVHITSF